MSAIVNEKKIIHQARIFTLMRENVTLQNGSTVNLDIIRHPGATAIVPFLSSDTVLLLNQYRHAIGRFIWEIPAGTLDPNEDPLSCAKRELQEETGYIANTWKPLGKIVPVPGYSDECIHLYIAYDLIQGTQKLDKDEVLHVHPIHFEKALKMITTNEILDGKTITGLLLAKQLGTFF
ncbi:MAG: NUDIX hydrolase [Desulfobacterales bacterium]|nr:NUDIX hydrolase [Desulfobacterales bacterium]